MKELYYVIFRIIKWFWRIYPVVNPMYYDQADVLRHDDGTPYKGWEKFEWVLRNLLTTDVAKALGLIVDKKRIGIARAVLQIGFVIWRYFGRR